MEVGSEAATLTNPGVVRLGRYELLGEIASGGMATVFLGRAVGARGFSRLVAIKRMHPHLERDEEFVSSFLDEARLAARIRHPNVVATLDVEDGDAPFLVMEYVEGDRLSGLIKEQFARHRRGIAVEHALRIAIDALEGLHAAHELREEDGTSLDLIHRDISPQNVLVGVDGVSRVTDFGIAKAAGRASHTRDGELKGKLAYMAPEQLTNPGGIDRRVDLFALGVVCWEMLTGRRLFRAATDIETIGVILHHEVTPLRSVAPEIPVEVESVVMRALERDPAKRWRTAQEFSRALESLGLAAPSHAVADFVRQTVGERLDHERARLRSGWTVGTPASSPGLAPGSDVLVSEVRRTVTTHAPAPRSRRALALALGASGAVLFMGAIALLAHRAITPRPEPRVTVRVTQPTTASDPVGPAQVAPPPLRPPTALDPVATPDAGMVGYAPELARGVDAGAARSPGRSRVRVRVRRSDGTQGDDDSVIFGQPTFDRGR